MYGAKEGENNEHENHLVLDKAMEHLAKIQSRVVVNIHYGSYEDCLGTFGNLYVQQNVLFKHDPHSDIALYAEALGNSPSDPTNKCWFRSVNNKNPEVAFAVLNIVKRVYLKMA